MIKKETFQFLAELAQNNHKLWFDAHREQYEAARKDFISFISKLIKGIDDFDHHLEGLTAEECVFRLYRDARYTTDKEPYKAHLGAYIAFGGRNSDFAGYYVHIAPGDSYIGGGMYNPGTAVLRKIRQEIDYNSEPLWNILRSDGFREYFGSIQGDRLDSAPQGYPKDHKDIELLKLESYFAVHPMKDEVFTSEQAFERCIKVVSELYHFNRFFNETFVS